MFDGWFNPNFVCPLCERFHAVRQCTRFQSMDVEMKLRAVAHHGLCSNCLAQSHRRPSCQTLDRCKRCLQDHNTWLHPIPRGKIWVRMAAMVRIIAHPGAPDRWTRALIDPTIARSAIMASEAKLLHCKIQGGRTQIIVCNSRYEGRRVKVMCNVENMEYGCNPEVSVERTQRHLVGSGNSVENACRSWHIKAPYYLILGSDVAPHIFTNIAKGRPGRLYAQDTIFGITYFG